MTNFLLLNSSFIPLTNPKMIKSLKSLQKNRCIIEALNQINYECNFLIYVV